MAITHDRISLKNIVSKVYRDLELTSENDYVDIIEWSVEALRFINAFNQYKQETEVLCIENYRADLPCNLVALLSVEGFGSQLDKASNNTFKTLDRRHIDEPHSYNLAHFDNISLKLGKKYISNNGESFVYKNGYIKTSFKTGNITITYNALETDEDGIPLIPDDESYRAAIFWYVSMKFFYKKSIMEDRYRWFYQDAEAKWHRYCGQAGTKAMMPDIFTLENIKRNFISFLPKMDSYKKFYNDLN